jgi:hypothetical protein
MCHAKTSGSAASRLARGGKARNGTPAATLRTGARELLTKGSSETYFIKQHRTMSNASVDM